jgi:hypothetical protein
MGADTISSGDFIRDYPSWFMLLFVLCCLFVCLFANLNVTSLHRFYLERLSKTFLAEPGSDKTLPPIPMEAVASAATAGLPYHIIQCAVQLPGSESRCFAFTPLAAYSDAKGIGLARPQNYQSDDALSLAKAMALSGAAVNNHAGTAISRPLAIILTLLNSRLGNWLPNPRYVRNPPTPFSVRNPIWPILFFKEMFSLFGVSDSRCMVTDGGHFENLGMYELVRRKCRFIIVSDAGCDPSYQFTDLTRLKELCDEELYCSVDLDESSLKPNNGTRRSAAHATTGTLKYKDGTTGVVVYVKSSLTGDEGERILSWSQSNRSFPHDTTMDQFFTRSRFHQYRALGRHIGSAVFGTTPVSNLTSVVQALASQKQGPDAPRVWDVRRLHTNAAVYDKLSHEDASESESKKLMLNEVENAIEAGLVVLESNHIGDPVTAPSDYLHSWFSADSS